MSRVFYGVKNISMNLELSLFFTNKITVLEYLTLIFYIEHLTSLCSVLYSHTEGWHSIFTEIFLRVER